MKRVKKILFVIISLLLAIVISFNLYNFICIKVLKQDIATLNGYAILDVVSGSMEPTIHVGDMIIINTKDDIYEIDDIVTFYDIEGSFVTHRIVSIDEEKMITKGDNNNTEDEEVSTNKIVGKYVMRMNGLGKLLQAFRSPFVMIMILVIGILACVFMSVDNNGNVILDEEEKEFQEYLKTKNNDSVKNKTTNKKSASKGSQKKKTTSGTKVNSTKKNTSKSTNKKTNTSTKKKVK